MIKRKRADSQSIKQSTSQSNNQSTLLSLQPFCIQHIQQSILPLYYLYMYLYMYTAACSVKGWPQKRAGAVETFLKTFVSASRWISLSLSVVRKKRLSPKYRACSPVLLVAVLSCLVLTECLDTVDSLICCLSLSRTLSLIHFPTRA